jgi:hypothetical protein
MLRLCQMGHDRRYGEIPRANAGIFANLFWQINADSGRATGYLRLGVLIRYHAPSATRMRGARATLRPSATRT